MNIRRIERNIRFVAALLAMACLIIGVSGARAASNPAAQAVSAKYQAWLNKQVHHELAMLPYYGVFDNLTYRVDGTQVTLSGEVVNPVTKSGAEASVKHLEGVTRVLNDITVLPLSSFDNQIRRAEYRAIFRDASLGRYRMGVNPAIHIIVDNGHVTLEGVVDNATDRNVATIRANSVPNVFSVTNHLRIA
ncbi:MAG TPA: BON domain-containing protein [Candidatus Acidoferrales bacterium]|nr:BON domain-containing protein [Candidatus Acidoferrales bacterium]